MKTATRFGGTAFLTCLVLTSATLACAAEDSRLPRARPDTPADASAALMKQAVESSGLSLDGPDTPRLPRSRPGATAGPQASVAAGLVSRPPGPALAPLIEPLPEDATLPIAFLTRMPRPRPHSPSTPASLGSALSPQVPRDTVVSFPVAVGTEENACLSRIEALGVRFTRLPPFDPGGACGVPLPLKVSAAGSGVVIAGDATMNCRTAEALALWVRDSLKPAARKHLAATPTALAPGSTYACRPRNNRTGAKLSEHAHANAFDVMSIAFADRQPIEILARSTQLQEGRFQADVRQGACRYFTTVLGPGSDAAHANHLHMDMAERRGGYRLCSLSPPSVVARTRPDSPGLKPPADQP